MPVLPCPLQSVRSIPFLLCKLSCTADNTAVHFAAVSGEHPAEWTPSGNPAHRNLPVLQPYRPFSGGRGWPTANLLSGGRYLFPHIACVLLSGQQFFSESVQLHATTDGTSHLHAAGHGHIGHAPHRNSPVPHKQMEPSL